MSQHNHVPPLINNVRELLHSISMNAKLQRKNKWEKSADIDRYIWHSTPSLCYNHESWWMIYPPYFHPPCMNLGPCLEGCSVFTLKTLPMRKLTMPHSANRLGMKFKRSLKAPLLVAAAALVPSFWFWYAGYYKPKSALSADAHIKGEQP